MKNSTASRPCACITPKKLPFQPENGKYAIGAGTPIFTPTLPVDTELRNLRAAAPEAVAGGSEPRTLTLRLAPAVHDRLREMAYTSRRSQHSLLLEALDDLFRKHGKPPIPS